MPALSWLSLTARLDDRTAATGVAMREAWPTVSPDRLTRRLPADGSGHTLRESACRRRFVGERGDLSLADTVMATPDATAMAGPAWGCSGTERRPVYGLSLALRVWTAGTRRMPVSLRCWPTGGPSQAEWALE